MQKFNTLLCSSTYSLWTLDNVYFYSVIAAGMFSFKKSKKEIQSFLSNFYYLFEKLEDEYIIQTVTDFYNR